MTQQLSSDTDRYQVLAGDDRYQVKACQVLTYQDLSSDRIIVEHNQAELSKLKRS